MVNTRLDTSGIVTIGRDGRGTGFVLSEGRVVTNSHHLRDRTTQVMFEGGRTAQATVVGVDADGDLAVLEVDTADARPATFASTAPAVGGEVQALSRAGTSGRVTFGRVSAVNQTFRGPRGRVIEGALEHTAPLPRGATGGPLVDSSGAIVAITTLRLPDGFAIARPTDAALQQVLHQLAEGQSVERRTIGVTIAPSHVANRLRRSVGLPERDGLLVRAVRAESPAERAGLRTGDLIVAVDATAVATPEALAAAIEEGSAERTIVLTIVRGAEEQTASVNLDATPHD
ncbi:MAG: S1C family serine protease [Acidimicrobiia bacterium]